jgi:hypothetical protein
MSNTFTISNVSYDGTSGSSNPLCTVAGTVNGKNVYTGAYFQYLQSAISAGQTQQALTAILFNSYANTHGFQLTPNPNSVSLPTFPGTNAVAETTGGRSRCRQCRSRQR